MGVRMLRPVAVFGVALLFCGLGHSHRACADPTFGKFEGDFVGKFSTDGRNVELTNPFAFRDADNHLWAVPTGTVVNGASIPQAFLTFIGGPFEGKFRDPSVIHDFLCDTQTATW